MMNWRGQAHECPQCGWQGLCVPARPGKEVDCPECGAPLLLRPWTDTWGLTLLILAAVVALVLFVAYAPQLLR